MNQLRKRMPKTFRKGHDDSLACKHRNASCCDACAKENPEIVEVYGRHFWVTDPDERRELGTDSNAEHLNQTNAHITGGGRIL